MSLKYNKLLKDYNRLAAFDINRLKLASDKIKLAGITQYKSSGVMVTITSLDGTGITGQFGVIDGLSEDTIQALLRDIERTFTERVELNTPGNLRKNTKVITRGEDENKRI